MRILVTGGAGYIGSVLVNRLLHGGHMVRVIDALTYGGDSLLGFIGHPSFEFVKADVRNEKQVSLALENIDSVIHLVAIVGEPLCSKFPEEARTVNLEATKVLVDLCKDRVRRFLFASTCSNYGSRDSSTVADEDAPVESVSLYAETKIAGERYVLNSKSSTFHPCVLRFATVYGVSPRMRFDLLLHEFIRDAAVHRKLAVYRPSFWRPLVHVRDVAEAVVRVLTASDIQVSGRVYNVGGENAQKIQLARWVAESYPDTQIVAVEGKEDARNYRVSFDRIFSVLGFKSRKTVRDGILEIKEALNSNVIVDPYSARYGNINYELKELLAGR